MVVENKYIKIFRGIIILDLKEKINRKELAIKLGISNQHPHFCTAINILVNEKICIEHTFFGSVKLLEFDLDKLDEFVRENSEEFALWGKYIETTKPSFYSY